MVDVERLGRGVERAVARAADTHELRGEVLRILRDSLAFDAHVWVLTDPVTGVGGAPRAEVPGFDLRTLIRMRYLDPVVRQVADRPVRLAALPSPFLRMLQGYGVSDVISVQHGDRYGCWAFMDLWRCGRPFTDEEVSAIDAVGPLLSTALRRCQARALAEAGDGAGEASGTAVVVVDDQLRTVGDTTLAQEWLARLLPPIPGSDPVPAAVYNVAAQLLAVEAGVDAREAAVRVHLGSGSWLRVAATRLADPAGARRIAVTMEPLTSGARLDLFVRAYGLSPREVELVRLVSAGASTQDAATAMHVSPWTVQDFLKAVFAKTGDTTRGTLVARALGVPVDRTG